MRRIYNLHNTVTLTQPQALELLPAVALCMGCTPEGIADSLRALPEFFEHNENSNTYKLFFSADYSEHMDYVPEIRKILQKVKASGEITFGSLGNDNAELFWGYRFTDNGECKYLEGTVQFKPTISKAPWE